MFGMSDRKSENKVYAVEVGDTKIADIKAVDRIDKMVARASDEDPEKQVVSESVISAGSHVKGVLKSPAALICMGEMEGEVEAKRFTLGEGGGFNGKLDCECIVTDGRMNGEILGREISAGKTARLEGEVRCSTLEMQLGGVLNGEMRIGEFLPDKPADNSV